VNLAKALTRRQKARFKKSAAVIRRMDVRVYGTPRLAAGAGLFIVCILAVASLAQQPDVILTGVDRIADRQVEAFFTLINPSNFSEGTVSVAFGDSMDLDLADKNWDCFKSQDSPSNTCTLRAQVFGQQPFTARFTLKRFFQSEFVYLTYQVPQANATTVTKFVVSHTPDPNSISTSAIFYSALALIFTGLALWVMAFESGRLKCAKGPIGLAFSALDSNILVAAVIADGMIALGSVAAFSPVFSPFSAALFGLVFACGTLFLFHARRATGRDKPCAQDKTTEKARLEEMVRTARAKYMRNEMDERTFHDVVTKLELKIIRLETEEKKGQ